jgi:KDO2-lipid IV(A) lauroyltransferase
MPSVTLQSLGYQLASRLSVALPARGAFRCAERLADVRWRHADADRAAVGSNLSMVLGRPIDGRSTLVREVFRNFARYLVEFFTIHRVDRPELQVEGYDRLREARGHRRGVILLTAHLGNWEVGAILLRRLGLPISVIALRHEDAAMDQLFNQQRRRCGLDVIPVDAEAARAGLRSLRDEGCLGLLGDREFGTHGMRLAFCRRSVVLPRGPALLSLRSRAPVVPVFLLREGPWKLRLTLEPPIYPQGRPTQASAVRTLTEAYAAVLERRVTESPEQWLIFQRVSDAN